MHETIITPRRAVMNELAAISKRFGVARAEIMGACRRPPVVRARWEAFAYLRDLGWTLHRIGLLFEKDQATVLHGLRRRAEGVAQ